MATLLDEAHNAFQHWADYIKHGAAWLVGSATLLEKNVADLEASDPLVKEAAEMAHSWASNEGVPVGDLAMTGQQILHLLQTVAVDSPVPAPAPTASPDPLPVAAPPDEGDPTPSAA